MLPDDEVLRTDGTPYDLSCCDIELQAQIALCVVPMFRTRARGLLLLVHAFFLSYTSDSCLFFHTNFPFLAEFLVPLDHLI